AQQRVDLPRRGFEWHAYLLPFLAGAIAPCDHARLLLQVLRAQLDAHRHAAQLPFREAEARRLLELGVDLHPNLLITVKVVTWQRAKRTSQLFRGRDGCGTLRVSLAQWADDNVDRRYPRRHDQSVVVGVRHDQGADEARRGPPTRGPGMLALTFLILEGDVER